MTYLLSWVDGVLTLERVDVDAEEQIDDIDESLCNNQCFPEIERLSHLAHELAVEHGTTIRVNSLHQPHELSAELDVGWWARSGHDWRCRRANIGTIGFGSGLIIGMTMSHLKHCQSNKLDRQNIALKRTTAIVRIMTITLSQTAKLAIQPYFCNVRT